MVKKVFSNKYLLCAASGVLLVLPFIFSGWAILSWVALVPFIYVFCSRRWGFKTSFWLCFVFAMSFYLPLYTWVLRLYPLDWLGFSMGQSLAMVFLFWLVMSLVQTIQMVLVLLLYQLMRPRGIGEPLVFASLWVLLEWWQGLAPLAFPWGRLAVSQYGVLSLIQGASLGGVLFISFLIVLVNALFAFSLQKKKMLSAKKVYRGVFLIAILIFVANFIYGNLQLASYKEKTAENSYNFAIIQGNVASGAKWQGNQASFDIYTELMQKIKNKDVDFVVWPETAIPALVEENNEYDLIYKKIARENEIYFCVGSFTTDEELKKYNSLLIYGPTGEVLGKYSKRNLVPVGEYLPLRSFLDRLFPLIKEINQVSEDLTPGFGSQIIETPLGQVGGLICFDSIFQNDIRHSVTKGAELLLLLTNDSWYEDSPGVYQHNAQAILRAVETGRYVVRAANTGISAIIRPTGEAVDYLEPFVAGVVVGEVSFLYDTTLYVRLGDIIVLFCTAIVLLVFLLRFKKMVFILAKGDNEKHK